MTSGGAAFLLVVTKLFAFQVCSGALHHYPQPVVDDYDKDLAVQPLRAADFAHAVPEGCPGAGRVGYD
jgi:hypothetical protein